MSKSTSSLKPASWVTEHAHRIPNDGVVLDLACGNGRHTDYFLNRGNQVIALDRDTNGMAPFADHPACEIVTFDLESPSLVDQKQSIVRYERSLPFWQTPLSAIVVVNYLYRPLLPTLAQALAPGGILIYQTFMIGNEKYGRPSNPDYLLAADELPTAFEPELERISFFEGHTNSPKEAVIQCYCGRKT